MEPLLIMKTASVLLALAAVGGLGMAGMRFAGTPHPPAWLAMGHGFLAGAAATLLLYAYFTVGLPRLAAWGLLLFIVAALGGIYMNLQYHMKGQALPIGIMIVHAAIAVIGFVLLVMAILA